MVVSLAIFVVLDGSLIGHFVSPDGSLIDLFVVLDGSLIGHFVSPDGSLIDHCCRS